MRTENHQITRLAAPAGTTSSVGREPVPALVSPARQDETFVMTMKESAPQPSLRVRYLPSSHSPLPPPTNMTHATEPAPFILYWRRVSYHRRRSEWRFNRTVEMEYDRVAADGPAGTVASAGVTGRFPVIVAPPELFYKRISLRVRLLASSPLPPPSSQNPAQTTDPALFHQPGRQTVQRQQ